MNCWYEFSSESTCISYGKIISFWIHDFFPILTLSPGSIITVFTPRSCFPSKHFLEPISFPFPALPCHVLLGQRMFQAALIWTLFQLECWKHYWYLCWTQDNDNCKSVLIGSLSYSFHFTLILKFLLAAIICSWQRKTVKHRVSAPKITRREGVGGTTVSQPVQHQNLCSWPLH